MLACWHEHTAYHVEVNGSTTPIEVGAGVRQGCKAAPWLFNAFVLLYLQDLTAFDRLAVAPSPPEHLCATTYMHVDSFIPVMICIA